MSKVRIDETAISSAEAQEVTAMKRTIRRATAPPVPRRAVAANGVERPAVTCAVVMVFGYVGNVGESVRATAARPNVVAKPNGMAYHARPPRM